MLPDYTEPEAKAQWTPLFDELRKRMAARGLEKAMLMGMVSDFWATKEQATALKEFSGGLPWINACHYHVENFHNGLAEFGYQASYFGARQGFGQDLHGWKTAPPHAAFERVPLDSYPIVRWRLIAEQCITGNVIGIGRLGADTWYAVKDKSGRRLARVWQRYPSADWGYLNADSSTLAPGPDGPVATARFEALREGVQECEAIILVDEALTDAARRSKLGDDLARRCEDLLKERNLSLWRGYVGWQNGPKPNLDATSWRENGSPTGNTWFLGSLWQQRSERLYQLAGEVEKKLAAK
jgi:hypothetical protein